MESITILYVEDELSLGKITNDTLKKNGFNVIWAKDGKEALEIILKSKIFMIDLHELTKTKSLA